MHYPVFSVAFLLAATSILSAIAQTDSPMVKKIEVYGQAEEEITPDEIYFSITLKEYQNKEEAKVDIDQLEKDLYAAVQEIGVAE